MKVYFASDHAGFEAKNKLVEYVRDQLKCEVEDCGALVNDPQDATTRIGVEVAENGFVRAHLAQIIYVSDSEHRGRRVRGGRAVTFSNPLRRSGGAPVFAVKPPSATIIEPVMYEASSDARNRAILAISSGPCAILSSAKRK
jgi:hypothetical protein